MKAQYMSKTDAGRAVDKRQDVIDREFAILYKRNNKTLNEEIILAAAKDENHPLHPYFEWDDSIAANNWRRQQALNMILASKMVVILQEEANKPPIVQQADQPEVRRLVNAFRGEGFKMRVDALADDTHRSAIISKHKAKLRGWCREVIDIEELHPLRNVILKELGDEIGEVEDA